MAEPESASRFPDSEPRKDRGKWELLRHLESMVSKNQGPVIQGRAGEGWGVVLKAHRQITGSTHPY